MQERRQHGFTLTELLIVVTILGIVAALAIPETSSMPDGKLRLAAQDIANAFRFARTEALRTGEGHGLTVSQTTQRVTVRKYDLSTAPISSLNTLTHPIDRQPYDFNVNTRPTTQGVLISNTQDAFKYADLGRRRSLVFDGTGTPKWIVGSGTTTYLLEKGEVELSLGNHQLSVLVAPVTGRVTVK